MPPLMGRGGPPMGMRMMGKAERAKDRRGTLLPSVALPSPPARGALIATTLIVV
jgi:hypothetical protein